MIKTLLASMAAGLLLATSAFAAVNLNTASQAELETLNGIGPAKAKAILEYRTKHGAFKSVDDLKNVSGFGDKTVEKLRKEVVVGSAAKPAAQKPAPAAAKPAAAVKP